MNQAIPFCSNGRSLVPGLSKLFNVCFACNSEKPGGPGDAVTAEGSGEEASLTAYTIVNYKLCSQVHDTV